MRGGAAEGLILVRGEGEAKWRTPLVTHSTDEAALEQILQESPELLPGNPDGLPQAFVRQLSIPKTGPADLVAVADIFQVLDDETFQAAVREQYLGRVFDHALADPSLDGVSGRGQGFEGKCLRDWMVIPSKDR